MNRRHVVICGTRFGENYLSAFLEERPDFILTGILARGSERSRELARRFGVPLYTSPEELPDWTDIVCVVVRSTIVGGSGTDLARRLLERGFHVLQEHPVHPSDITRLKEVSRGKRVRYHINSFYPHLKAGATFIDYLNRWSSHRRLHYIELTTSLQLLFSSLDLLGRAFSGLAPFACAGPLDISGLEQLPEGGVWPFHVLQGLIRGTPFSLKLQSYLDQADPDHHSLVMHRISAGGPEGSLTLVNSFGPVVWSHPVYAPNYNRSDAAASYLINPEEHRSCRFNLQPTALIFGDEVGPSLLEAAQDQYPQAIFRALEDLAGDIERPDSVPAQSEQYLIELGQTWLEIMRLAGLPREVSLNEPPPPFPDPVSYAQEVQA
jgi:thiazolinyl imide reductase